MNIKKKKTRLLILFILLFIPFAGSIWWILTTFQMTEGKKYLIDFFQWDFKKLIERAE